MSDDFKSFRCQSGFSSPPCYAAEVAPEYFDPLAVDPEQARDVARWRKAERTRLRNARLALSVAERKEIGEALAGHLRQGRCQTDENESLVGQDGCPLCDTELTPLSESSGAVQLEILSAGEAALRIEVVEDRGIGGNEHPQASHPPEP